jgi:predicted exporter
LIVLAGADEQSVLRAAEQCSVLLDTLQERGVIAGYQSPARFLPSISTQRRRQSSLPPADELRRRLSAAAIGLPLRVELLEPFLADAGRARDAAPITRADLAGTSLEAGVDALLQQHSGSWNALLPLQAPLAAEAGGLVDTARVARAVGALPLDGVRATVLDLKRDADALYDSYLREALYLSLAGFASIALLLLLVLRSVSRAARVLAPLVLAVLAVLLGFAASGRMLNILHLIGLLLVIAVGSNYALFFARGPIVADDAEARRMLASLALANLTTVLAFGVLGFSTVPVLAALGTTVAPGALLALLFSALLAAPASARGDPP